MPTIGRIVHYRLTAEDAAEIDRRRTTRGSIAERMADESWRHWPEGAQAHLGNPVSEGQVCPAIIVAVWSDTCVNLRVMLDGTDEFWALSRNPIDMDGLDIPGRWFWPEATP